MNSGRLHGASRPTGLLAVLPRKEACHGECIEDGDYRGIYSLRAAGLSCREIAKCLGIQRETVSRHLRLQYRAGFEAPTGASMAGRASTAAPWLEWMLEQHAKDLSTKRIHQDLVAEFPGASGVGYDSVRRLLKKLGAVLSPPFRRMDCLPGHEAQIDFGTGAPIIGPDGRRRRTLPQA